MCSRRRNPPIILSTRDFDTRPVFLGLGPNAHMAEAAAGPPLPLSCLPHHWAVTFFFFLLSTIISFYLRWGQDALFSFTAKKSVGACVYRYIYIHTAERGETTSGENLSLFWTKIDRSCARKYIRYIDWDLIFVRILLRETLDSLIDARSEFYGRIEWLIERLSSFLYPPRWSWLAYKLLFVWGILEGIVCIYIVGKFLAPKECICQVDIDSKFIRSRESECLYTYIRFVYKGAFVLTRRRQRQFHRVSQ